MRKIYLFGLLLGMFAFAACNDDDSEGEVAAVPGDAWFADTALTALETEGVIQVKIALSKPAPKDYAIEVAPSVEYDVVEGEDYILASTKIEVKKGETEAFAEVELIDNKDTDPGRYLELRIMDAGGGNVVEPSRCRIDIRDDESECAVVFPQKGITVYENEGEVVLPIRLEGKLAGQTVRFRVEQTGGSAVEGEDFVLKNTTLEFELTATDDSTNIVLELMDDEVYTGNRAIVFEIVEAQGAILTTGTSDCRVDILDDDIMVSFVTEEFEVEESGERVYVPVQLTNSFSTDVTLNFAVADNSTAVEGTDFNVEKTLVIPAGRTSAQLEVEILDREGVADDRTLVLEITGDADGVVAIGEGHACSVNILECDVTLSFAKNSFELESTDAGVSTTVSLSQALQHDVTFSLSSSDTYVFAGEQESYTIPAGETSVAVAWTLTPPTLEYLNSWTLSVADIYGASGNPEAEAAITLFRLNKAFWSIAYVSSEEAEGENGVAANLIDDNESTFWHNQWYGVTPALPCETVVNLSGLKELTQLELVRRSGNSDTKKVEIYLTTASEWSEAIDWGSPVATVDFSSSGRATIDWSTEHKTATFVLVRCVEGNNSSGQAVASLAELTLWGWAQ